MKTLNLETKSKEQELIKTYLETNASDILAKKINNGVEITIDEKKLLNKKSLEDFMKFACEEAKKLAEKSATSACIEDSVVYGWAIHYFEEDSIQGKLFNIDGTEYKVTSKTIEVKTQPTVMKEQPKKTNYQFSLFDINSNQNQKVENDFAKNGQYVNEDGEILDIEEEIESHEEIVAVKKTSNTSPEFEPNELTNTLMKLFDNALEVL